MEPRAFKFRGGKRGLAKGNNMCYAVIGRFEEPHSRGGLMSRASVSILGRSVDLVGSCGFEPWYPSL